MNKNMTVIFSFLAIFLTGCAPNEETVQQKEQRINSEKLEIAIQEQKGKVPQTEIVAKILGREDYIHKFYDEKTGATCYFIDYTMNNISCVK